MYFFWVNVAFGEFEIWLNCACRWMKTSIKDGNAECLLFVNEYIQSYNFGSYPVLSCGWGIDLKRSGKFVLGRGTSEWLSRITYALFMPLCFMAYSLRRRGSNCKYSCLPSSSRTIFPSTYVLFIYLCFNLYFFEAQYLSPSNLDMVYLSCALYLSLCYNYLKIDLGFNLSSSKLSF